MPLDVQLAGDINAAIGEDGRVRDSASEEVRRARGKVMTIEGRIRGVLKNQGGEVTEQVRRFCPTSFELCSWTMLSRMQQTSTMLEL